MCQPMPAGLPTRYKFDANLQKIKPRQSKSRGFEKIVLSYARRMKLDCRSEKFYTTVTQKEVDSFNVVGFCGRWNAVFEAVNCFYPQCPCQEAQPALTEEDSQRGTKKAMNELWKQYIEKKYHAVKTWECEWWKFYKTDVCVKQPLREIFPNKRPFF